MTSKCLICMVNIKPDLVTTHSEENCEKIFKIFCKFFCRELNCHLEKQIVPFCQKCHQIMVTLFTLDEEVEIAVKKIKQIVGNVTKEIIESGFQGENHHHQNNCDIHLQTQANLTANSSQDDASTLFKRVDEIRDTILKKYRPAIVLNDLNSQIPITPDEASLLKSEDEALSFDQSLNSSPNSINYDSHDDDFEMKEESPEYLNEDSGDNTSDCMYLENDDNQVTIEPILPDKNVEPEVTPVVPCSNVLQVPREKKRKRRNVNNKCFQCDVGFPTHEHLKGHIREVHKNTTIFICQLCRKRFKREGHFIRHQIKAHPEVPLKGQVIPCGQHKYLYDGQWFYYEKEGQFKCLGCGQVKLDQGAIVKHLKDHNSSIVPPLPEDLKSRQRNVHGKNRCKVCHKRIKFGQMEAHQSAGPCHEFLSMNKKLSCPVCQVSLMTLAAFRMHVTTKHSEIPLDLEIVECGYGNLLYNKRWIFVKMVDDPNSYQCHLCGKSGIQTDGIKKHVESHPGFTCSICGILFKLRSQMTNHNRMVHLEIYNCPILFNRDPGPTEPAKSQPPTETGKKPKECTLDKARYVMTSEGQYLYLGKWKFERDMDHKFKCTTCGQQARAYANLRGILFHLRTVHDDPKGYKFMCEECGKGFHVSKSLNEHKTVHLTLRPFKCDQCPSTFKTMKQLGLHFRVCHNPNPWLCEQCPKIFTSKRKYQNHYASIHSDLRAFQCPECQKTFKLKKTLEKHKKTHWKKKKPGEELNRLPGTLVETETKSVSGKTFFRQNSTD